MKNFLAIALVGFFAFGMAICVQGFMERIENPLIPITIALGSAFYIGYGVGSK